MIGLQVSKSDLFYDSEFDYLIDPKNRKESIPYFDEGITVLYFDLFIEKKNRNLPFKRSISEKAAKILVKHLLAMGNYANYTPSHFINKSLKENEIHIYIGKKYEKENEKVLSRIEFDEEIKALKNYYLNSNIQIRNNKFIQRKK